MKVTITGMTEYNCIPGGIEVWFDGDVSDQYHTMHELYQHRMALNIALFHAWSDLHMTGDPSLPDVFKSLKHSDGTMFEGYFIVMAVWPSGRQISYHYKLKHWDKFKISERGICPPYDGHNSKDTLERLENA